MDTNSTEQRVDRKPRIALLVAAAAGCGCLVVAGLAVVAYLAISRATTGPHYGSDGPHSGWSVAWAGDADGDGVDDVLIATEFELLAEGSFGRTRLLSGKTGARLWTRPGTSRWQQVVSRAGDVDGDGKSDLLISEDSRLRVIDLASERTLLELRGDDLRCFGPIRDVDLDGCGDLFVRDDPADGIGRVRVVSGRTGATVWSREAATLATDKLHHAFGWQGAVIGDIDRDGIEDVAVNTEKSHVRVLSGASGETLREFGFEFDWLGELFRVGDLDGDGSVEVLATNGFDGPVRVLSPATGRELFSIPLPKNESVQSIATLTDFDGDGVLDIAMERSTGLIAYSGRDGRRIRGFDHVTPATGSADVDGDGRADILVVRNVWGEDAEPLGDDVWRAGEVEIRSALTGTVVRRWDGNDLER